LIKKIKLNIFKDNRGDLLKYLDKKKSFLKNFGETYFNEIKKNKLKGWIYHKKYTCLITVPYGKIELRYKKKINSKYKKITIGKKKYFLIVIPPKTWFSFRGISNLSIIVNTINGIHKDNESLRLPIK